MKQLKQPVDDLRPRQLLAVATLIQHATMRQAAEAAKVSERTLRNWMKLPEFRAELRRYCREAFGRGMAMIQEATPKAIATLTTILDSRTASASARVSAAIGILKLATKAFEFAALEDIEEIIAERRRGRPQLTQ
jgi:hypothetical protein